MAKPSLIFPREEFAARTRRLQAKMAAHGIDALLLTQAADIFYLTGFLTRFWESPARPWFVVLPAQGVPVAVIPSIGEKLMRRTWISEILTWNAPDPSDDGVTLLSDTLAGLVPETGKIGVPKGIETHLRMALADYERLVTALAPRVFVDGSEAVHSVRAIKSSAELEKIRNTCEIAGRAFDRVGEVARMGVPLCDVFREFQMLLLEEGADWVSYLAGGAGPGGYGDVISPASNLPLRDGDVMMLDTGAVCDGYFCDFDRNFAIGSVTNKTRRCHAALWEATEDVLTTLRPGVMAADVHRMFRESLAKAGFVPCPGRLGHGLGISLTEWPSFTPLDQTELREGMVLTLEPSAAVEGDRLLVHEENIVLHASGAELLSPRAPYDLPVL